MLQPGITTTVLTTVHRPAAMHSDWDPDGASSIVPLSVSFFFATLSKLMDRRAGPLTGFGGLIR